MSSRRSLTSPSTSLSSSNSFISHIRSFFQQQIHKNPSEIDPQELYDFLQDLKQILQSIGNNWGYLAHDLLLIVFVECRNETPDINVIIEWMKTRLRVGILPKDAEMILKYMKLFRPLPSEEISEYDAFLRMEEQDPFLYSSQNPISKESWCKKTNKFIINRKNQIYWDNTAILERREQKIGESKISKLVRLASSRFQSKKIVPHHEAEDSIVISQSKLMRVASDSKRLNFKPRKSLSISNRSNTNPNLISPNVGVFTTTGDYGDNKSQSMISVIDTEPLKPDQETQSETTSVQVVHNISAIMEFEEVA